MIKIVIKFYKLFVSFNFFISICALCLFWHISLIHQQNINFFNSALVCLLTFVGYFFLRFISYKRGTIPQYSFFYLVINNNLRSMIAIYSILCFIILYLISKLEVSQFTSLMLANIIFILYEQTFSTKYNLRSIPYMKNVFIAFTWSLVLNGLQEKFNWRSFIEIFKRETV